LERSAHEHARTLGGNNWKWRLLPGEITDELIDKIAAMTKMYGR
jgi:4-alpha-glucanotransferase